MSYVDRALPFALPEEPFHPAPEHADRLYDDYYAALREIFDDADDHLSWIANNQSPEAMQLLPVLLEMLGIRAARDQYPDLRRPLRRIYPWLEA